MHVAEKIEFWQTYNGCCQISKAKYLRIDSVKFKSYYFL